MNIFTEGINQNNKNKDYKVPIHFVYNYKKNTSEIQIVSFLMPLPKYLNSDNIADRIDVMEYIKIFRGVILDFVFQCDIEDIDELISYLKEKQYVFTLVTKKNKSKYKGIGREFLKKNPLAKYINDKVIDLDVHTAFYDVENNIVSFVEGVNMVPERMYLQYEASNVDVESIEESDFLEIKI